MTQSCFGRALSSSFLLNALPIHAEEEESGLEESPPHTVLQKCSRLFKPMASVCAPLSLPTGFDPETRDPEFLWLSRYRCAEPEAQTLKPREWNSDPGTPSGFTPIGGGRYQSRNARQGLEDILLQELHSARVGGTTEESGFLLAEEAHGGGPVGGQRARGGRRDEVLEEADWEMSAGGGSRERDCAGRAIAADAGLRCRAFGRNGGSADGLVGRRSSSWPRARRGMLRLKFCREVPLRRA